jgi:CheY-like chemotaxis protein
LDIGKKKNYRIIVNMASKIKKHILIIDDEPTWLKISSHILRNCGYDVHTAGSGKEALKARTYAGYEWF